MHKEGYSFYPECADIATKINNFATLRTIGWHQWFKLAEEVWADSVVQGYSKGSHDIALMMLNICSDWHTICQRSSYPIYIVIYYIKWETTSWMHSICSDWQNQMKYEKNIKI